VVSATYAGTTDTLHLSGVEVLSIEADGTANVDLTDTTGLVQVRVDDDNTAAATTLTDLAAGVGVLFTVGAATSSLTIDMEDATSATDSLNVELVASVAGASTLTVGNVETLNLDVEGANFNVDLGATAMTAAGATSTLNITGDNALTISGTDTDIRTIDASGMVTGGSVVQTGREATGASTYTGSLGADTFIMMSPSDVLVGGGGSDTLDINYAAILGGLSVDLTSTTDQIVSWNGSATSGTVTGFENVDVAGYTGSFGALLVGTSVANTIIGTNNADQITGGGGDDAITGGTGGDVIDGGAGQDTYTIAADASNITSTTGAVAGIDTVTVTDTDLFSGITVAAVVAAVKAEGTAVDTTGTTLLASLDTAFKAVDDGIDNIEAAIISYTGGEQFLVIDTGGAAGGAITAADVVIQLVGTATGLTLTGGAVEIDI